MNRDPKDPLIFILGNARSGTSMMGRILGNHPCIHTFNELHFFDKLSSPRDAHNRLSSSHAIHLAARLATIADKPFYKRGDSQKFLKKARDIVKRIENDALSPATVYAAFLRHEAFANGKTIPCEQTPTYTYYLQDILDLFPGAKIINMIRDPRDVLHSQKHRWKRRFLGSPDWPLRLTIRTWMNYHPISTSQLWKTAVRSVYRFKNDKRICFVKFEDVLRDAEKEIRRICKFIGVSYSSDMMDVPMIGSSLVRDRPDRIGIDKNRAYHWKRGGLNSTELYICQIITGDTMKRPGYTCTEVSPNPFRLIFYLITFPAKLFLVSLMHMTEIKDFKVAVKRRLFYLRTKANKNEE